MAHNKIELQKNEDMDKKYQEITTQIHKLNVKFDCIICFSCLLPEKIRASEPKALSFSKYQKDNINLMILGKNPF